MADMNQYVYQPVPGAEYPSFPMAYLSPGMAAAGAGMATGIAPGIPGIAHTMPTVGAPKGTMPAQPMMPFPFQIPGYPMGYPYPIVPFPMAASLPGVAKTLDDATVAANPPKTLFIGNLAPSVTPEMLNEFFSRYGTVTRVKHIHNKNYAFVSFSERSEAVVAKTSGNGEVIEGRPMRISWGRENDSGSSSGPTPSSHAGSPYDLSALYSAPIKMVNQFQPQPQTPSQPEPDSNTLFVGNLTLTVTEELLRSVFSAYGNITRVKVSPGKHYGFVSYQTHEEAVSAFSNLNETMLAGRPLRLNWGRKFI